MRRFRALLTISMMLMLAAAGARAHADAALLMEEPYGLFGGINPTGHAAIYLNHVCADTPTHLRPCRAGEAPKGDWTQLVGASYDRKIYGFEIETTREEDERFIAEYNDKRNESHFN